MEDKDQEQFTTQLLYYLAGFAGGIPVFVLRDYAKYTLSLRWRSWMTSYYMDRYLKNRTFYKIQSQSIIHNPDQRIVDDLSFFTGTALACSLTFFNATVDLITFSNILYGIYPPLFIVLLAYSLGGTAISVFLGRGLVRLNFLQEKKEADFRYGLVRVRENAESIAFYGGEENEIQLLLQRFRSAFENLSQLLISSRNLEFFTNRYRYLIQILAAAVVASMYFSGKKKKIAPRAYLPVGWWGPLRLGFNHFSGKIEFGVINQSVSAFSHILGDFSFIVYQFQAITAFSAVIDRLDIFSTIRPFKFAGEFDDVLSSDSRIDVESMEEIKREFCCINSFSALKSNGSLPLDRSVKLLNIEHLTLLTPSKSTLVRDLLLEICEKDHLLVTGPSGSGKTSLLRAIAGLWNFGQGIITFYYKNARVPDPHVSTDMGSLPFLMPKSNKAPDAPDAMPLKPTTNDLTQVLEDVRLGYILSRFDLDSTYEWSSVLSLGEQQRLAFARLLLSKSNLVLLDESTSA
ncbi:ABC transporter D family member 2, chloroplastic [Olea europaea subsp. europaea]|uniref:ABC transporter D family member 2, chloroplastic n=1 Tax=Olea europaea subsp. europaea TaxID=158383 RepID=A0A8S0PSS4_OLEEU|nr:ABC transporter D family member 2, chloroplastic [Olea europaea subsp. europaea]